MTAPVYLHTLQREQRQLQGGDRHQSTHPCIYLGGGRASSVVWHQPCLSNQGVHTRDGKRGKHRSAAPSLWSLATPPTKAKTAVTPGRNPIPSGYLILPLRFSPSTPAAIREMTVIEHRRSPGLHLAFPLASPTPALSPTKKVAASTPQGTVQYMLTSDTVLPPNHWADADCVRTLPHKDTPSRLG